MEEEQIRCVGAKMFRDSCRNGAVVCGRDIDNEMTTIRFARVDVSFGVWTLEILLRIMKFCAIAKSPLI